MDLFLSEWVLVVDSSRHSNKDMCSVK